VIRAWQFLPFGFRFSCSTMREGRSQKLEVRGKGKTNFRPFELFRSAFWVLLGTVFLVNGLSCTPPKRIVPAGAPMAQVFTLPATYRLTIEVSGVGLNLTKGMLINTVTGKVLAEFCKDQGGTLAVPVQSREADVNIELRGYVMQPGSDAGGKPPIWEPMPIKLASRTATSLKFVCDDGYANNQPPESWNHLIVVIKVVPQS
jgi:hypothetical protein